METRAEKKPLKGQKWYLMWEENGYLRGWKYFSSMLYFQSFSTRLIAFKNKVSNKHYTYEKPYSWRWGDGLQVILPDGPLPWIHVNSIWCNKTSKAHNCCKIRENHFTSSLGFPGQCHNRKYMSWLIAYHKLEWRGKKRQTKTLWLTNGSQHGWLHMPVYKIKEEAASVITTGSILWP